MRRCVRRLGATVLLLPSIAAAQKPARIVGAVIDSLRGKPLSGAEITLSATSLVAITDSLGRFQFDSVPPGAKQIGVFHPLLDSLGISIGTRPFSLGLDSVAVILLSVPSAKSLIRQHCGPRPAEFGKGLVMGRVLDPESGEPVHGSRVAVRWTHYEVKARNTLKQTPRAVTVETDQSGAFKLCGLPTDVAVRMQATRNGLESPDLEILMGSMPIVVTDIAIQNADKKSVGVVTGKLSDPAGHAVAGAYVEIQRLGISSMTDAGGEFALSGVAAGTQILIARKIGFIPIAFPIVVAERRPARLSYLMSRYVPILDEVRILGTATAGLARVGFTQRQKAGLGNFVSADEIEKQGFPRLSEVLGRLPGLKVDKEKGQMVLRSTRAAKSTGDEACLRLMIDGNEWILLSPGEVDNILPTSKIAAIELYLPMDVPPEYSSMQNCTTVLVWTKSKTRVK